MPSHREVVKFDIFLWKTLIIFILQIKQKFLDLQEFIEHILLSPTRITIPTSLSTFRHLWLWQNAWDVDVEKRQEISWHQDCLSVGLMCVTRPLKAHFKCRQVSLGLIKWNYLLQNEFLSSKINDYSDNQHLMREERLNSWEIFFACRGSLKKFFIELITVENYWKLGNIIMRNLMSN